MGFLISDIFVKLLNNLSEYFISNTFEILIILAVNIINFQTETLTLSSIVKWNLMISYFGNKFKKSLDVFFKFCFLFVKKITIKKYILKCLKIQVFKSLYHLNKKLLNIVLRFLCNDKFIRSSLNLNQDRNFFILSNLNKNIYNLHNDEDNIRNRTYIY